MKNSAAEGGCQPPRQKPRWITHSEICQIIHIVRKLNSIAAIDSKYFQILKGENEISVFLLTKSNTASFPGFLGEGFNNLQQASHLTSF